MRQREEQWATDHGWCGAKAMRGWDRLTSDQRGQGTVEYIGIVVMVALSWALSESSPKWGGDIATS